MSAIASGSRFWNERGVSRHIPVAATTCIPDASDSSRTKATSRPRSGVLRSIIVSTPTARAARSRSRATRRVASQLNSHG